MKDAQAAWREVQFNPSAAEVDAPKVMSEGHPETYLRTRCKKLGLKSEASAGDGLSEFTDQRHPVDRSCRPTVRYFEIQPI